MCLINWCLYNLSNNVTYVERTKGKTYRAVPLNARASEILTDLGQDLFSKLKKESVIHKFNDLITRLKMPQFKLHSLRDTFATRLVSKGVDLYAVKELLGHQDIRTSMICAKADTERPRLAVTRLESTPIEAESDRTGDNLEETDSNEG